MIPQEKTDAVRRGLRAAFAVSEYDEIAEVKGGHTNSLVYRVVVRGAPYLLKIIVRAEDPTRHYASMRAAAAAGVAPRVWYTDIAEKISITDFVRARTLAMEDARARLPEVLRTLHRLAPFDRAPFNTTCTFLLQPGLALDGFLQKFRASQLLPAAESEEFFARYAELAAVCPRDEGSMASSHNDLFKPDNILFDGERVWLVDWEAAFLNDRYADLAVVANQLVAGEDEERAFLERYLGAPADEYQLARLHLMRQLAHLFYTMAFLYMRAPGGASDWSAPLPEYAAYQRRLWAGEMDLADHAVKFLFARVHWARLLENVGQARYREALRIVAARGAAEGAAR